MRYHESNGWRPWVRHDHGQGRGRRQTRELRIGNGPERKAKNIINLIATGELAHRPQRTGRRHKFRLPRDHNLRPAAMTRAAIGRSPVRPAAIIGLESRRDGAFRTAPHRGESGRLRLRSQMRSAGLPGKNAFPERGMAGGGKGKQQKGRGEKRSSGHRDIAAALGDNGFIPTKQNYATNYSSLHNRHFRKRAQEKKGKFSSLIFHPSAASSRNLFLVVYHLEKQADAEKETRLGT